jgi:putative ABC transport system permease protein
MRIIPRLSSLWNTLFRKDRLERELDDEIRAAVETLADRYAADGMTPQAARRAAVAAVGGPGGLVQVKAAVREGRIGAGLDSVLLDLRYAWRGLVKAPGFTAIIVVTLALGIGANTAIFSVVHAMLLEPLPYRNADRLAFIWLDKTEIGYPRAPLSGPDLGDLRHGTSTFAEFGGIWASGTVSLTGDGDPEQLRGALVTSNFFRMLGAESAIGRTFREEDSAPGATPTVLLGWDLFQRRFGRDPSIVGRRIVVNDELTTVIGVMPRSFSLLLPVDSSVPDHLQVWQPFWPDLERGPRGNLFLRVVGRMRPGVTIAQARADVDGIAERITSGLGARRAFTTVALQADTVREIRGPLLALFVGVGILLLIACVNVASLLVARAASRATETALRLALGASRSRLLRQSLVEGLLLTLLGAAAGVFAGYVGLRLLLALAPESLSRIGISQIDLTVLAFTVGLSLLWGLLFSLAPTTELFRSQGSPLQTAESLLNLRSTGTGTPVKYRTRAALVVVQVALSVVLLVGAALLVRAFLEVQRVDVGFQSDRHLTFRVALPESRYPTVEATFTGSRELRRRLAAIPGVTSVGAISHLPYDDLPNWGLTYALEATKNEGGAAKADTRSISMGLLETLGVQLIDGSLFADNESPKNPVVIVDEMLARRLWPGERAVGRQFFLGQASPDRRVSVLGVVRHLRIRSLVEDLTPQVYVPYRLWQRSPMAYIVRTDRDPSTIVPDVRAAVASFDPRLPIYDARPMATYVDAARSVRRFTTLIAAAFAASALLLTCIGVYGVLAYAVAVRRHEFGVRRALGADTMQVIREVVREGMGFALAGCVGGIAGAAMAARLLQSQLYVVNPRDPLSYAVAVVLILGGAVIACWIPARRATVISPMDALRTG